MKGCLTRALAPYSMQHADQNSGIGNLALDNVHFLWHVLDCTAFLDHYVKDGLCM